MKGQNFYTIFLITAIISILLISGCGGGGGTGATPNPTAAPTSASTGSLNINTDQNNGYATCDFLSTSSASNPYSQIQLDSNGDGTFHNLTLNSNVYVRVYTNQSSFQSDPNNPLGGESINFTTNGQTETVDTGNVDPTPTTGPDPTATPTNGPGTGLTNLFFLHHSTGDGIIVEGDMRGTINNYNSTHGTSYAFWDHGYNGDGLRNPSGDFTGTTYNIPNDDTDPVGLHYLFTSPNQDAVDCRNLILSNHEVIAFKSCFPGSHIPDQDTLNQYKAWYLEMRNFFDQHPEKLFVVMSTPPLHRLDTNATEAANARAFANWLKSAEYLSGHPNIVCFDLFDNLAGSDNMLRYEYEGSHSDLDSHPNTLANQTVGPVFANFLINSAANY